MGDVVNFPISLDSDLGRQLILDCCRFQEKILTEQQVRKKYRFDEAAWEALGNDEMVRAVEEESVRRIRDGSSKREKSQLLVTKAPDVAASIMLNDSANDRHRLDACKVLNDFSANGPGDPTPAADRFIINIVLNSDGAGGDTLTFNKRITPLAPGEIDPDDVGPDTNMIAAVVASKKSTENGGGELI